MVHCSLLTFLHNYLFVINKLVHQVGLCQGIKGWLEHKEVMVKKDNLVTCPVVGLCHYIIVSSFIYQVPYKLG